MTYQDKLYFSHAVEVRRSPLHGYGVFALRDISKGEIIEECYTIRLLSAWYDVDDTLKDFVFATGPNKKGMPSSMVALGHAMIYNHDSKSPNVDYENSPAYSVLKFSAAKDILKDEELFITYGETSHSVKRMEAKKNG